MSLVPTTKTTNKQMIVTMTVGELSSMLVETATQGALIALQRVEKEKVTSQLLEQETLTIKEVGSVLSISRATVNRWANNGILKKMTIGGTPRFYTKDVKKLLEAS